MKKLLLRVAAEQLDFVRRCARHDPRVLKGSSCPAWDCVSESTGGPRGRHRAPSDVGGRRGRAAAGATAIPQPPPPPPPPRPSPPPPHSPAPPRPRASLRR